MIIILWIILFAISLAVLIKGADFLVDGAADMARYFRISPLIVGITIVALGTSLPELIVGLTAVLQGTEDIAIGNVIGSNIANIGLILGIAALLTPLKIRSSLPMRELPFMMAATFLFIILSDNRFIFNAQGFALEWHDGIIFLALMALFLYYVYTSVKKKDPIAKEKEYVSKNPLWKNALFIGIGLAMLVVGGKYVVQSATEIALLFGVSEAFVGLTIVAVGTSLPEFATSIVAALKKEQDIAIGNIVGSNIFNILFILGIVSTIKTVSVNPSMLFFDAIVMLGISALLVLFATSKRRIDRWEGGVLLAGYAAYIGFLIVQIQ